MKNHGFTLLELIITIALAAILLGLAVPNLRDFIQNSRMTAQTNEFVTAFNLARSEALKRNRPVSICALNNIGTACANSNPDWSNGWLLYVDSQPAGESSTGSAEDIRIWQREPDRSADVAVDPASVVFVRFLPDGRVDLRPLPINEDDDPTTDSACGLSGEGVCFVIDYDENRCRAGQRLDRREVVLNRNGRTTINPVQCATGNEGG